MSSDTEQGCNRDTATENSLNKQFVQYISPKDALGPNMDPSWSEQPSMHG